MTSFVVAAGRRNRVLTLVTVIALLLSVFAGAMGSPSRSQAANQTAASSPAQPQAVAAGLLAVAVCWP